MRKEMHSIAIDTTNNRVIAISQAVQDIYQVEPMVHISPEQAVTVATWILQATATGERKEMHAVCVEAASDGSIEFSQVLSDVHEPDPKIHIAPEQASIVASWVLQAAAEIDVPDLTEELPDESVPIKFWNGGPESDHNDLDVFLNTSGMVVLKISDSTYIEIAPSMAKRLSEKIGMAVSQSFVSMLMKEGQACGI